MKKLSSFLEGYFGRIGYKGTAEPSLATLRSIHAFHPDAIPFENLNPFFRLPVLLDKEALYQKLVAGNRGGYCFEQNLLLSQVLQELGFKVRGLAARVLWNQPVDAITPRGHMLLLVTISGRNYIADVGFGGLTMTAPLLLEANLEQPTPHEPFRLLAEDDEFRLQALIRNEWKSIYRFALQPQFLPDYEVSNWYLSNHPESHFINGLMAARSVPGCRFALHNNELAEHRLGGGTKKRVIERPADLKEVLEEVFGLRLAGLPHLEEKLGELILRSERAPGDAADKPENRSR